MASEKKSLLTTYLRRVGAGSLLISLGVHFLLVGGAVTYVITTVSEERKAVFRGDGRPPGGAPAAQQEHRVSLARQQSNMAAQPRRLTVNNSGAQISLPDLPDLPSFGGPVSLGPSGPAGSASGLGGLGLGTSPKAPPMPLFGFRQAQAEGTFVGSFFDLKQTPEGKPSPELQRYKDTGTLTNEETMRLVRENFSQAQMRRRFFESPTKLYAAQFLIPFDTKAESAPQAFQVEGRVKPSGWLAHYRARVSPLQSGDYRFWGRGDDILVVRINSQVVLDGSWKELLPRIRHDEGEAIRPGHKMRLRGGPSLRLEAGVFYDMDVVIGEGPGVRFGAALLFEHLGPFPPGQNPAGPQILRVGPVDPPESKALPTVPRDGPVWRARLPL